MFGEASREISQYLTTGMHHSTVDAQTRMTEIIERCVAQEFAKHTPNEFSIKLHQTPVAQEYSI